TPPMSEINSVKYSSNVEGKYPLSVIIDATRTASVRLESSVWRGAAGIFSIKISESDWVSLNSVLTTPAFAALENPEGLPPGTGLRSITLRFAKQRETEKWAVGAPQGFVAAERIFLNIVDKAIAYPEHAITISSFDFPVAASGEVIPFSVTVKNVGKKEIRISNPRNDVGNPSELVLRGVRTDKPVSQFGPSDYEFWDVDGDAIDEIKALSMDNEFISLSPGDSLIVKMHIPSGQLAGRCTMTLRFAFDMLDKDDKRLGRFELVSEKEKVVLTTE
ncbi:MAG TPA: hypothetical protein VGE50_13365, partial [Gammaproteobacteria bacterium]